MLNGTTTAGSLGGTAGDDQISQIVLDGDAHGTEYDFGEIGLRAQYISIVLFFASTPPMHEVVRGLIARGEDLAGNAELAGWIRDGASQVDVDSPDNDAPVAAADEYDVTAGNELLVDAVAGVLQNDSDRDDDSLTAQLVSQPGHGAVVLDADGSFSYVPDDGFSGVDTFTYRANDGVADSDDETVQINVASLVDAADLVAFARALADAGTVLYGAAWSSRCTEQKELFEDGANFLPFVDVTKPDRTPKTLEELGISTDILTYPTWERADGTRLEGLQTLAELSDFTGVAIPLSSQPFIVPIDDVVLLAGSPLHIPLDAYDPNGGPLTYTITGNSNSALVSTFIPEGNRSMQITVAEYGKMVFELFEGRAPRATERIIELAWAEFYDGVIFHRVIDGFMIQSGDPTGTGSGGSSLGDFDDQFEVDLQHNRSGILSMAKSDDDTNDSQFFITEVPTRHLDSNHTVFGQLVEGDSVREAVSNVPVDGSQPDPQVVMTSVDIFLDEENRVLMLSAAEGATGQADITVTVTDQDGHQFVETFHVTVEPDSNNSPPFLADIPVIETTVDTPVTFQLTAIDVEEDTAYFLDEAHLDELLVPDGYGSVMYASVPARAHADLHYEVDLDTGLVTVTPTNGLVGTYSITVGTAVVEQVFDPPQDYAEAVDYQVVQVVITS